MTLTLDRCEIECVGEGNPLRLAAALLKQLPDVTRAIPIEEIAQALDITEIIEQPFASIEAVLQTDRCKSAGVIGVRAGAPPRRRRFSIAHELGHFLNERHEPTPAGLFTCTAHDMRTPFGEQRHARQEREANAFAAELLLPRTGVAPFLRGFADLDGALKIADRFDASREAASRRYVELHREKLAVVFVKDGVIRYAHKSEAFPWIRLATGDQIGAAPMAPATGDPLTGMDEVDAESWLERGGSRSLYAQTLRQADGRATVLLLLEEHESESDDLPRFGR